MKMQQSVMLPHVPLLFRYLTSSWARCVSWMRTVTGATSSTIAASRTCWGRSTQTAGTNRIKTPQRWAVNCTPAQSTLQNSYHKLIWKTSILSEEYVLMLIYIQSCIVWRYFFTIQNNCGHKYIFFFVPAAMPHSEDPGRGHGERHYGVSAQHQLQSLRPARTVSPPVCS